MASDHRCGATRADDGTVRDAGGALLATSCAINPIGAAPADLAAALGPAAPAVIVRSGTLVDDPAGSSPLNFMPAGQAAGRTALAEVRAAAAAAGTGRVLLSPHARHICSDIPSTLTWLREHAGAGLPVGLALAPADLFEPSMLATAPEHLERMFAHLGPRADLVLLHDVEAGGPTGLAVVPFGTGALPWAAIRPLLDEHVPPEVPIVFSTADADAGRAWLDSDGRAG